MFGRCFLFLLLATIPWQHLRAQQTAIPHAHNDYEHTRPLFDAITNGFRSVEADVHLFDDRLLVGHNRVNQRSPSLESLYLKPLDSLIKVPGFCRSGDPFRLMIDIKTSGKETLELIYASLKDHPGLGSGPCRITLVVSGNVPKAEMLAAPYRGIGIDGRPDDLGKEISAERMPWVSDRFSNWGTTDGAGAVSGSSLEKISTLARKVHAEGKLFRLWAIPDTPKAWKQLRAAGVDLLNTDRLAEMRTFLEQD